MLAVLLSDVLLPCDYLIGVPFYPFAEQRPRPAAVLAPRQSAEAKEQQKQPPSDSEIGSVVKSTTIDVDKQLAPAIVLPPISCTEVVFETSLRLGSSESTSLPESFYHFLKVFDALEIATRLSCLHSRTNVDFLAVARAMSVQNQRLTVAHLETLYYLYPEAYDFVASSHDNWSIFPRFDKSPLSATAAYHAGRVADQFINDSIIIERRLQLLTRLQTYVRLMYREYCRLMMTVKQNAEDLYGYWKANRDQLVLLPRKALPAFVESARSLRTSTASTRNNNNTKLLLARLKTVTPSLPHSRETKRQLKSISVKGIVVPTELKIIVDPNQLKRMHIREVVKNSNVRRHQANRQHQDALSIMRIVHSVFNSEKCNSKSLNLLLPIIAYAIKQEDYSIEEKAIVESIRYCCKLDPHSCDLQFVGTDSSSGLEILHVWNFHTLFATLNSSIPYS